MSIDFISYISFISYCFYVYLNTCSYNFITLSKRVFIILYVYLTGF